jgi:rare lipoprotein A
MNSIVRKNRWLYAVEGAATVAGLLLAGCSTNTTAVSVVPSPTPTYSNTFTQPSGTVRTQPRKAHVVTASRYDPRLAGDCTSNGESYDPKGLTAASRTIPMGSTVKVTNVDNGHSVDIRINDRGPFVKGRSLDLSDRAARDIGLNDKGLAMVKITQSVAATAVPSAPCN